MSRVARWAASTLLPGATIGLIGLVAWVAGMPALVPSLGPTVALQATKPSQSASKPYHVAVGHVIGMLSGLAAVFITGAVAAPPVLSTGVLDASRVVAAAIAVALSVSVQKALRASHPPAEATTLLIALGAVQPKAGDLLALILGIALVTALGEAIRRFRLRMKDGDPDEARH